MASTGECVDLSLESIIGFTGSVPAGLQYTPCGNFIVYPLGSVVVLRSVTSGNISFLDALNNDKVSCVALSKDGRYLASGQESKGSTTKADAFLWDLERAIKNCESNNPSAGGCLLHRLNQHIGKVQSVDFNCDSSLLVTLGGQDDNDLVVWDVKSGESICGSPAANDSAHCSRWLNRRNDRFVTCGNCHLRVWQICTATPKLHAVDASMGSMRRVMQCLSISNDDKHAFAGSKTGEVLKFRIDRDEIRPFNEPDSAHPSLQDYNRDRFSKGVRSVACIVNPSTGNTNVLVGAGDGIVQILNPKLQLIASHRTQLSGAVTSLSLAPNSKKFYAGTDLSQRYSIDVSTFTPELHGTCHFGEIYDIKFPKNCSDLFLTASSQDIRVWNTKLRQEMLRIRVPNNTCHAIELTSSGGSILSGWSDGKIRVFYPETGKLKFIIPEAHDNGVTSLALCNDDLNSAWRVVSGGNDGRVRVWKILKSHQSMVHSMKEHRGAVNAVVCNNDGTQAVSASADGSCIVWDIIKGIRIHALFEPTIFNDILLHPDESQYLTCGSHTKISYWDAYDASQIRVIEGSINREMTCLSIQNDGVLFASGGADKLLKLWNYDDGVSIGVGRGHSGTIHKVVFSPDQQKLISVGSEGGIFIWKVPTATF
eukprot:CAMPEP_0194378686 /NCGR_PEP_ID=MMETSP0174-20130528/36876_1 /TAXON_ID=216777 /ORGANISM="Proboscia alata, Strain PI-D3" /LENGTH=650 /DNA_ID=CAMNT_0039160903 /DNA_START=29 /DNA_END=1981 /DNA_ORIENTATION=-